MAEAKTRIARYRRQSAAVKYATEIHRKFPSVVAIIVQHPYDFGWAVQVTLPTGKTAYADKRPRNYASDPFHHRIASQELEEANA